MVSPKNPLGFAFLNSFKRIGRFRIDLFVMGSFPHLHVLRFLAARSLFFMSVDDLDG